jgi:hypothetical protein
MPFSSFLGNQATATACLRAFSCGLRKSQVYLNKEVPQAAKTAAVANSQALNSKPAAGPAAAVARNVM